MLDRTFLLDSRFSRFNARLIRDEANDEERKAIAIRNDEKRSETGRNNLFVIVVYCENRRKFRESFRGKKSARISPPSPRQEMEKNQYLRRYDLCLQLFSSRFKKDGTVDENRTS